MKLLPTKLIIIAIFQSTSGSTLSGCDDNQMRCPDGKCIHNRYLCNEVNDCGDNSDEQRALCDRKIIRLLTDTDTGLFSCIDAYIVWCDDFKCVSYGALCDGKSDCANKWDETLAICANRSSTCNGNQIRCPDGKCIPKSYLCDGKNDCGDSSDEQPPLCARKLADAELLTASTSTTKTTTTYKPSSRPVSKLLTTPTKSTTKSSLPMSSTKSTPTTTRPSSSMSTTYVSPNVTARDQRQKLRTTTSDHTSGDNTAVAVTITVVVGIVIITVVVAVTILLYKRRRSSKPVRRTVQRPLNAPPRTEDIAMASSPVYEEVPTFPNSQHPYFKNAQELKWNSPKVYNDVPGKQKYANDYVRYQPQVL